MEKEKSKKWFAKLMLALMLMTGVFGISLTLNLAAPTAVLAADDEVSTFSDFKGGLAAPSGEGLDQSLKKTSDARSFIISVVNFVLGFLGLAAVIVIVYAGILYVTAAGNDENVGKAKNAIKYAVIGILIIAGSYAIVNTVINFTSGDDGTSKVAGGGTGDTGTNLRGTNSQQGVVYNFAANEVRAVMNSIENGYKNFVAIDQIVTKLENTSLPETRGEYRSFISQINNLIVDIINHSDDFSEVKRVAIEFANGPLVALQNAQDVSTYDDEDGAKKFNKKHNLECLVNPAGPATQGYNCGDYPKVTLQDGDTTQTAVSLPSGLSIAARQDFLKIVLLAINDPKTAPDPLAKELINDQVGKLIIVQNVLGEIATNEDLAKNPINVANIIEQNKDLEKAFSGIDPNKTLYSFFEDAKTNVGSLKTMQSDPGSTSNAKNMVATLKSLNDLYLVVQNLRFVDVRIKANTTQGNAPFVVELSALESRDPSNQTISDDRYHWSVDKGTGKTESTDQDSTVVCSNPTGDASKDFNYTGPVIICTFTKEGTYIARLSIESSDRQHVASGTGTLAITVKPSLANIVLKYKPKGSTADALCVTRACDNEQASIQLTREMVKGGIEFIATESKGADKQPIPEGNFSWSFGDGSNSSNEKKSSVTHQYTREGTFPLSLEVTDKAGRKDRKILMVIIASIAAQIDYSSLVGEPGQIIEFDGTGSHSDGGPVASYEWKITQGGKDVTKAVDTVEAIGGSDKPTLRAKFKRAGLYKVSLIVSDASGKNSTPQETPEISIKSHKPRGTIHISECPDNCPKPSEPSVVEFDATGSFDPDTEDNDTLKYTWSFTNDVGESISEGTQTYQIIEKNNVSVTDTARQPKADAVKKMKVRFAKKGKYKVTLKVEDTHEDGIRQSDLVEEPFEIKSIVGMTWSDDMHTTTQLQNNRGTIHFVGTINNADTADIDFGDGETADIELTGANSPFTVDHDYDRAKEYVVTLHAQSDANGENSIQKRVVIAPGDQPRAVIHVFENDSEIILPDTIDRNNPQILEVLRGERITFDGTSSITSTGSQKVEDLSYVWDFGDGDTSTKEKVTHTYQDLTAEDALTSIKLTVSEKKNPSKTHTTQFPLRVTSSKPSLTALTIEKQSAGNETPVTVMVRAEGARDADGRITNYQFWYYQPDHPEDRLGVVDTASNQAELTVETYGNAGDEHDFIFCAALTDSDNSTAECNELLSEGRRPHITVKNGPNKAPTAKFEVQPSTTIHVGEEITFTSSSTDEDGQITDYIWDVDGDGFQNDNPTDSPTITHRYNKKSTSSGFKVKLKVIDDKKAAGYSTAIPVYVTTFSNPPRANFRYEIDQALPLRVHFFDASTPDQQNQAKIEKWKWDFDGTQEFGCTNDNLPVYCNGNKTDDEDSKDQFPVFDFPTTGRYLVTMTVTDNFDTEATITQYVDVRGGAAGVTNNGGGVSRPRDQRANADLKAYYANRFSIFEGDQKVLRIPANACAADVAFFWGDSRANDVPSFKLDKNIYHDGNGDGNRTNDYQDVSVQNQCVLNGVQKNNCTTIHFTRFDQQTSPRGSGQFETELSMFGASQNGVPGEIIDKDSVKILFDKTGDASKDLTAAQCAGGVNTFGASLFKDIGLSNSLIYSVIGGVLVVGSIFGIRSFGGRGKLRVDDPNNAPRV